MTVTQEVFDQVADLVDDGLPISAALKKLKINRQAFYKAITPKQRTELNMIKTTHTLYGIGSKIR